MPGPAPGELDFEPGETLPAAAASGASNKARATRPLISSPPRGSPHKVGPASPCGRAGARRSGFMSLAKAAVRGAAWTMVLNMASRAIGLLGTLVITRYLAPHAVGEVTVAVVLVTTAHQFSLLGLGHYVVAKPHAAREAAFHSTVMTLITGVLAIGGAVLMRDWLAPRFDAPAAVKYLPGLALAAAFDRVTFVPSRILMRDMRFKTGGLVHTAGELVFPFVA